MAHTWKTAKLRDLGDIQAGRQRSPHFTQGSMRQYLRVANVFDGYIDTSDVFAMPFTQAEFDTYRLELGDILLNEGQSRELVGRPAMYCGDPPECCFQNTLIRFRAGPDIDPEFALVVFQHYLYTGRFSAIASQTTSVAHLGVGRFADLEVSVPSLSEQRAIVDIVSAWNRVQGLARQLISAKQERKLGLMQQLLTGRRRLAAFTGDTWMKRRLGDLFRERRETHREDLPLLSITGNQGIVPRELIDRRDTSNEDKSLYLRICPGDIGYNTMRMWQGVSAVSDLEGIVSPAYTICIPGEDVDACFMGYLFKLPAMIRVFKRYSQGLVDDTLSLKFEAFSEIEVWVPQLQEQRAIASALTLADLEVSLSEQQLELRKQQKRGLMQQLITGKVRVPA